MNKRNYGQIVILGVIGIILLVILFIYNKKDKLPLKEQDVGPDKVKVIDNVGNSSYDFQTNADTISDPKNSIGNIDRD